MKLHPNDSAAPAFIDGISESMALDAGCEGLRGDRRPFLRHCPARWPRLAIPLERRHEAVLHRIKPGNLRRGELQHLLPDLLQAGKLGIEVRNSTTHGQRLLGVCPRHVLRRGNLATAELRHTCASAVEPCCDRTAPSRLEPRMQKLLMDVHDVELDECEERIHIAVLHHIQLPHKILVPDIAGVVGVEHVEDDLQVKLLNVHRLHDVAELIVIPEAADQLREGDAAVPVDV
mmetsp:Transcript_121570/g.350962  ORF Transcript_121570/g.350962 Transcript_121570/m.350962 type:complete len:232 (-) Transcript_121570:1022-1717(-)